MGQTNLHVLGERKKSKWYNGVTWLQKSHCCPHPHAPNVTKRRTFNACMGILMLGACMGWWLVQVLMKLGFMI